MSCPGLQVDNSPFRPDQIELLGRLLPTLTPDQGVWLSGYLAGVHATAAPKTQATAALSEGAAAAATEATVLYGSQTGNAKRLAEDLARRLQERNVAVTLSCMSELKPANLKKVKNLFVLVSTHGEGDPPDKAKLFHEFLHGKRAPRLEGLRYAVLGLGDFSYKAFCKMGKDFDRRLEELGAERLHPRADCDVDYEEAVAAWTDGVLAALGDGTSAGSSTAAAAAPDGGRQGGQSPAAVESYSRSRPFLAEVLENLSLNGRGSDQETRHLKLLLEGSALEFAPGDSLGMYPQNQPELVEDLIGHMRWDAEAAVPAGKQQRPLRQALTEHYEITVLTRPLLEQAAVFSRDGLADMVHHQGEEQLDAYVRGRDVLDLVRDFALAGTPAADFVRMLRRMPPRLYSIASSCRANRDEVDLLVRAVRYEAHQRPRYGTCSVYCAERVQPGDRLPVYVQSNDNFRLPADPSVPVIMVGPGTGVAPYRAFLEDREESGATGKTWLFFGDRRFRTDFLYQTDWLRWLKLGVLTRMDVAFSRDGAEKVYVQHRMAEHGRELFAWLEEGAYFYVCGDAGAMAADVEATLEAIIQSHGGRSAEDARGYVSRLQQEGRYQRDVY
ncbi:MAG: assimilatory sulfite reductase (NADPH) flavoprotein subunit [Thermoguttaceae bacterium]